MASFILDVPVSEMKKNWSDLQKTEEQEWKRLSGNSDIFLFEVFIV